MPEALRLQFLRLHFAGGGEAPPKRLLVAKWGLNKSIGGDYIVNETTAREMPLNQHRAAYDTVALDFEHNTVPGSPAYKAEKEPRNIAAKGTLEVVPGEGIYLNTAHWTPEGVSAHAGKQFEDLSPAILTNKAREIIFLHSVALCRQGATEGLSVEMHSGDPLHTLFSLHSPPSNIMPDYKKLLLLLLSLGDNASDAEIHSAATAFASKLDAAGKQSKAIETMSADFTALVKRLDEAERSNAISQAIAAGKVVPNSASSLPLKEALTLLGELPAGVVPMDRRTPDGLKLHSSSTVLTAGSEADETVRKTMGITEEKWKAHNGA